MPVTINVRLAFVCLLGLFGAGSALDRGEAQDLQLGLNIDSRLPGFEAQVNRCLDELSLLGDVSSRLVSNIRNAQHFVVITDTLSLRNGTQPRYQPDGSLLGVNILWNPSNRQPHPDGAPRIPCAALLHELQHADDILNGSLGRAIEDPRDRPGHVGPGEVRAVRTENWYLWRFNQRQRRTYEGRRLPDTVIWGPNNNPGGPGGLTLPPLSEAPQPQPQPMPMPPSNGSADDTAGRVTLTVVNETPNLILIASRTRGEEMLCGGQNRYFRARSTERRCTLRIQTAPERNPFAVPLITLVAYYPSGDPSFPRNGRVVWTDDRGGSLDCGGNAYSEYCQIQMGTRGSAEGGRQRRAVPASRTVHVRYEAGVSGIASVRRRSTVAVSE